MLPGSQAELGQATNRAVEIAVDIDFIFSVLRFINVAHGDLLTVGA